MSDIDISDLSTDSSASSDEMLELQFLSSDEEMIELLDESFVDNVENNFEDIISRYSEDDFIQRFRVSRHVAESIIEQFENSQYFHYQSGGNGKVDSVKQVLVYLWFVGHQTASFRDVADEFDISISMLYTIIKKCTYFLSNLSSHIITWPTDEEKVAIEAHFKDKSFPGVIGVIDRNHIKIDKPANDPDSYLNQKHFFSIQLQVVCDHQRKIRDVFVGYPGSVHNSGVFETSPLAASIQEKCQNYYVLGDASYPCLPNLLTPFKDGGQLSNKQQNYNFKLAENRSVIDQCFGLLKQKFCQLHHIKLRNLKTIVHFIRACCVLHNLALEDNFVPEEETYLVVKPELEQSDEDEDDGLQRRNHVASILNCQNCNIE